MRGADHVEGGPFLDQSEDEGGGALLAGEIERHHSFLRNGTSGMDDAIYAGARLLEILSQRKERTG